MHVLAVLYYTVKVSLSIDVMFSSAHRSKGLEFETVIVADDFTTGFVKSSVKEGIYIPYYVGWEHIAK